MDKCPNEQSNAEIEVKVGWKRRAQRLPNRATRRARGLTLHQTHHTDVKVNVTLEYDRPAFIHIMTW